MKHAHHSGPAGHRPGHDSLDLEEAFELLLGGKGPAQPESVVSDLRAESIGLHYCTYCDQPATVSLLALDGRHRTLLCGACRPRRG